MESANDHKAHNQTYGSFIGTLKWSVPLIAIITLVVVATTFVNDARSKMVSGVIASGGPSTARAPNARS